MSNKFSSFQNQQLLVEGWRNYLNEQQQVAAQPAQTPIQKILALSKQPVGKQGPSEETRNAINDPNTIRQLQALISKKDLQAAMDYLLSNVLKDDDAAEVARQTQVLLSQIQEAKKPGPVYQTTATIMSAAEKGLTKLGGGDLSKGLNKFGGASATMVLAGMILTNLVNAYTNKDPNSIKDAVELLSHLKNSLTLSNTGQLAKFITDTSQEVQQSATQTFSEATEYDDAHLDDGTLVCAGCLQELLESQRTIIQEAKYQGRTVTLNKPMKGDVKKSKVYVKDPQTGNVKKVNFGDKNMKIKKNIPGRRKSFRARHNCANPGPKTKARYWSCKAW